MSEQVSPEPRHFNHTGFYQYLAERRLMAARCIHCGEIHLPPRALCPRCYQSKMEWVELSGEGRLEGFTVIYLGLPVMSAAGYHRQNPYCAGVVRLPEGPAITAQILAAKDSRLAEIHVGDPVRIAFISPLDSEQARITFEIISRGG